MININIFEDYIKEFYYEDLIKIYFGDDAIKYIDEHYYKLTIIPHRNLFNDKLVFIFTRKSKEISLPLHYNQFKTDYQNWLRKKKFKRILK